MTTNDFPEDRMTEQPVNCSPAPSPVDLGVEVERLRAENDAAFGVAVIWSPR